jgi:hypothetical protein
MDMVIVQAGKFQDGQAHVGVIEPGVATDSNTIDLSYSPPRAPQVADGTTPQKTAVYPRIIPRTGQFGTVSELKPSHTLLCFMIEAHGKHATLVQGHSAGMLVHGCECFR